MAPQLKDLLRTINLKTFNTSNMSLIRFYNSGVPCYRDESADEAYEGLIRQFNSGYNGYYPKQVPANCQLPMFVRVALLRSVNVSFAPTVPDRRANSQIAEN